MIQRGPPSGSDRAAPIHADAQAITMAISWSDPEMRDRSPAVEVRDHDGITTTDGVLRVYLPAHSFVTVSAQVP